MAVYYIGSYDIDDFEQFQDYGPKVAALLPKYGGELLASDTDDRLLAIRRDRLQRSTRRSSTGFTSTIGVRSSASKSPTRILVP